MGIYFHLKIDFQEVLSASKFKVALFVMFLFNLFLMGAHSFIAFSLIVKEFFLYLF